MSLFLIKININRVGIFPLRGKLVRLITLILFEIFAYIWLSYISGEDSVSHVEWLPPLAVLLSYLPSTNLTGESLCAQ